MKLLTEKKNILVTTHLHPDPDAVASALALCSLLSTKLPDAKVKVSLKGRLGGGLNAFFQEQTDSRFLPWEEERLGTFDAIVLVDTQPHFANNPLPAGVAPIAVIDHHRSLGRNAKCAYCDIRSDVGATGSIIFSYFMELEVPISRDLGALLLYAIESDLAGAAGQPGELDNIALSSLTLIADTRKLYKMRYVNLPQNYYQAYANGIANAMYYECALMSHIEEIDTPEQPAVVADFLLRFEKVQWALVTAVAGGGKWLVMSLRTNAAKTSAADVMKKLARNLGQGGGHRTKAGGAIKLESGSAAEVDRIREVLRRRYLRAVGVKSPRGSRLLPKPAGK